MCTDMTCPGILSGAFAYGKIRWKQSVGRFHETSLWPDAVLFWNRNDTASFYPGDVDNFNLYHWMSGPGVLSVLLLTAAA